MKRRSSLLRTRCALASSLACMCAAQSIISGSVPELPLVFVRALDYNASLRWREPHAAACTRAGLPPCTHACALTLNASAVGASAFLAAMYGNASATSWSASLAARIVASFPANATRGAPHVYLDSGACCGSSIWCSASPGGYSCSSHGEGGLFYVNNGWTGDDSLVPVYACMQSSMPVAMMASTAPLAATVTTVSTNRLRIDGARFGVTSSALAVYTNGVACTSVDVCSNVCSPCRSSSECGDDKVCLIIAPFVGFCLRPCGSPTDASFCPCGAACVPVQGAADTVGYSNICMNPSVLYVNDVCAWGSWRPTTPGLDSRVECTVAAAVNLPTSPVRRGVGRSVQQAEPPSVLRGPHIRVLPQTLRGAAAPRALQSGSYYVTSYAAGQGYKYGGLCAPDNSFLQLGVAVVRAGLSSTGVDASLLVNGSTPAVPFGSLPYGGNIPAVNITWADCNSDLSCTVMDACTVPRCVPRTVNSSVGCCVYFPSGRCTSDDKTPVNSLGPVVSTYIALPSEVSSVVPMPPVPTGAGSGMPADMSMRHPTVLPYAINWDASNVWYTPQVGAFASNYSMSAVRHVDDVPLSAVPLPFTFPFFGQALNTLYLSANGLLRIVDRPPCGNAFSGQGCTVFGQYDGGIMPLATDFDPRANNFAEVWVGAFDGRSGAPGGRATPSPINASQAVCVTVMNVPLYARVLDATRPPNPAFNLHMCVFGDGGIRWRYGAILNQPAFAPGAWNSASTIPPWGGPPNGTMWAAGVRALGAGANTDTRTLTYNYLYSSLDTVAADTQTLRTNDVLLTRRGVRPGGTFAMCAHQPVACMSSACGAAGTVVTLQWRMPSCGMGFDFVAQVAAAQDSGSPRVECVFGGVAVTARVQITNVTTQSYVTTCVAPAQTRSGVNGTLTVPVSLRLVVPTSPLAYAADARSVYAPPNPLGAGGIGASASYLNTSAGTATIALDVYGVFATTVSRAMLRSPSTATAQYITTQTLMFTYSPAGVPCGCSSANTSSTCDACGVCGGSGVYRDCAGVCFGYAAYDDCGVCAGGSTGVPANANKDCNGVCNGPGAGCSSTVIIPQEPNGALSIIIIVALVTCSGALFSMLLYFAYVAIYRRRQQEIWLFEAALEDDPERPRGLAQSTIDAMPLLTFSSDAPSDTADGCGKKVGEEAAVDAAAPHSSDGKDSNAGSPATTTAVPPPTESSNANTCSICLADYEDGDNLRVMPVCRHRFHVDCIAHWLRDKTQCPVCRADLRTATEINAEAAFRAQRAQNRPTALIITDRSAVRVGVMGGGGAAIIVGGNAGAPTRSGAATHSVQHDDDDNFVDEAPRPGQVPDPVGATSVMRAMHAARQQARAAARAGRGAPTGVTAAASGAPRPPVVPRRSAGGPLTSVPPPGMLPPADGHVELRAGPLRGHAASLQAAPVRSRT